MNIVGLVTEYNPFHLGHLYHLNKSKELSNCDYSISIMSGNFLQRGEPALVDKWTRAKMAIESGVDLVVELPFVYACQSAELFAYGAVKILNLTNSITNISFGTEDKNLYNLNSIANVLIEEPETFSKDIKNNLKSGLSYPKSRELALLNYFSKNNINLENIEKSITSPNNILGIEYLKALKNLTSPIKAIGINRLESNHNDKNLSKSISSATSIRNSILKYNDFSKIKNTIPSESLELIKDKKNFNFLNKYSEIFLYKLLSTNLNDNNYIDLNIDLKNRILNYSKDFENIDDFISIINSKNYNSSRIRRSIIHILMDLYCEDIERFFRSKNNYLRVLGSNKKGFEIIKKIKKNSDITIINKLSDFKSKDNDMLDILNFDIKSSNIYNIFYKNFYNSDYTTSPYIKK